MPATAITLGSTLQFGLNDFPSTPRAAIVTAVHDDGKADLTVFLGYCQGTMDVQNVEFSDDAAPGKVSKLGAKPAAPVAPTAEPVHAGDHDQKLMFDWKCWIETKGEENEESTPKETARDLREITKAPVVLAIHSPSYEYAFLFCWRATDNGIEPFECPAIFVVTHDDTLAVVPDCLPQMKLVDAKGHSMKFLTTFAGARSSPMGGYLASRGKRFEHEDRERPSQLRL